MNVKRTGIVARLAKEAREEISRMLYDGATYRQVIAAMAAKGILLHKNVLTTWMRGGYQDWLTVEERLVNIERLREFALRVVQSNEGTAMQQAGMKVAAAQIYELLLNYDLEVLKEQLKKGDASDYAKVVNLIAKLSDGGLKQEKHRDETKAKERKKEATKDKWERMEKKSNLL